MEANAIQKKERQYYIDWLRILLILSVFLFHVGMVFNTSSWHIKSETEIAGLQYLMSFLHTWRMPLLFLVSGVGTFYALKHRNSIQYVGERIKRLYIPITAGIIILVPVQVYIEKIDQYPSLINFYSHFFEGIYPTGNFGWHHLWFIVYLFIISLVISPFLSVLKTERFKRFQSALIKILSVKLGTNLMLIPLILSQIWLYPLFPRETHALMGDWAFFVIFFIFFLLGLFIFSNNKLSVVIKMQRRLYLIQSLVFTALLLSVFFVNYGNYGRYVWHYTALVVAWSCSMTSLGYARTYLNFDSKFRKMANEAIYPFYLLHQPIIIVITYYILQLNLSLLMNVFLITSISFSLCVGIYWFIIRPFNVFRIIFGMKTLRKKDRNTSKLNKMSLNTIPIRK